ncbi:putative rab proteins geranylgeranyltransferase component a protein [Botrytis fragariae]|uniref:Putative rab proteins geranylgeranyltransferase component a protein n=1 Tax=Botrytis fragariae TaxID=1964551 RepID=A0A8H6B2R2_9HELO|nr:putative rab proteins geranylgeranyltransferase component a protein [Botrytis fragariae]KAF5878301.1 putative rab proteins geranylgeranyltransferase component a protein [Botrytis fragariae]
MLSTGTIPQSLSSIHNTFANIVPDRSLGIPISLFAGLATTSLIFLTLRDTCAPAHVTRIAPSESKSDAKTNSHIIPSPLKTQIPTLSHEEISTLPYPPDIFPGARDVPSPYGSTRAYEFGPVTGPKVLLIHGISTPCIALHSLATTLATTHGCRVLLFDLFGRGYSDGVSDLPHDERLHTTQILLVLTSSSLSWVGDGFHILGFSLGGGIVVDFAVAFPKMVKDVILLAPAGLIREEHFGWKGKTMRKWWFPDGLWGWILRRRVRGAYDTVPNSSSSPPTSLQISDPQFDNEQYESQGQVDSELTAAVPASSAATNSDTRLPFDDTPISSLLPHITVGQVMRWQTQQHQGYANAFASSIMHASISGRKETYKKLWGSRNRIEGQEKSERNERDKILVIVGEHDDVIVAEELEEDLKVVVGERFGTRDDGGDIFDEKIAWKVIESAGHEFPITRGEEVASLIGEFLGT